MKEPIGSQGNNMRSPSGSARHPKHSRSGWAVGKPLTCGQLLTILDLSSYVVPGWITKLQCFFNFFFFFYCLAVAQLQCAEPLLQLKFQCLVPCIQITNSILNVHYFNSIILVGSNIMLITSPPLPDKSNEQL